ncbi:hypothetical protein [Halomarina litorea]|uniref:hypothetical protein n=1 Tax=Halomarina litorea TaxID=2961595 RepID=UPI0020C2F70A|nr:hypothetical protein [Halomarina sp. BCD28]
MTRTARAALIALLVFSALAGCSTLGSGPDHRVRVVDQDDGDNAITVAVFQDGERVDRVELDGEGESNYESALTLDGSGEYRVRATVENGSMGNTSVDLPAADGSFTTVGVDEDGSVHFETGNESG